MNTPEHQGKEVDICMFVDSDHVGEKVFCRSRNNSLMCEHCISAVVLKETV